MNPTLLSSPITNATTTAILLLYSHMCDWYQTLPYIIFTQGRVVLPDRILAFLTFIPFFITSIGGFQDASAQGTEGLTMKESKLVKILCMSHRGFDSNRR